MTGQELIDRIHELKAENKEVYLQPKSGNAYKEVWNVDIEMIGLFQEILAIKH